MDTRPFLLGRSGPGYEASPLCILPTPMHPQYTSTPPPHPLLIAGLQQPKGVHCHTRTTAEHRSGLLAHGVGTERAHYRHGDQPFGGRSGKHVCVCVCVGGGGGGGGGGCTRMRAVSNTVHVYREVFPLYGIQYSNAKQLEYLLLISACITLNLLLCWLNAFRTVTPPWKSGHSSAHTLLAHFIANYERNE